MVKQATLEDIPSIEEILFNAVEWLDQKNLSNCWTRTSVLWDNLSKSYQISEFYIIYDREQPVACMAITDHDTTYWPDLPKGDAFYVHKVAVKRQYAGKGYSNELLAYAKKFALDHNVNSLRLDCNRKRQKLRKIYENQGFVCVKESIEKCENDMSLYLCKLN